ncbi:hypothetical protein [Microbacterium sp. VKM Ac-2923]|nr:hypothetical protein [Microbacterium sp. VKM Ac-2923]MCJ1709212.1 hypothetical protein [Microbacterium sp. VKM Ac-2923]
MEIDKSTAEEMRGKKLVVVPDGSGKPGRFTTKYVDAAESEDGSGPQ